jgi:hypothetical protein
MAYKFLLEKPFFIAENSEFNSFATFSIIFDPQVFCLDEISFPISQYNSNTWEFMVAVTF